MKFDQFIGPFTSNVTFNKNNVTYLQIGVERPHSAPISELLEENNKVQWPIVIGINRNSKEHDFTEKDYVIFNNDILEFELNHETVDVTIYENNNPYLIINVAYQDAD